jgi:hypothetical protein
VASLASFGRGAPRPYLFETKIGWHGRAWGRCPAERRQQVENVETFGFWLSSISRYDFFLPNDACFGSRPILTGHP